MIMLADRLVDGIDGQETFGGIDMTVRRNAFGRQVDSFEGDIALAGINDGQTRSARSSSGRRGWSRPGAGVEVLGTDLGTGRIVAVRQGRCWPRRSTRS